MKHAEAEKKALDDYEIINNLAVLKTLKAEDEPAPRNGAPKSRKGQRPIVESDLPTESPGPSPSDGRPDMLKRVKGTGQRSSSVTSQNRAATGKDDTVEGNRGILAEKNGLLTVGAEVFYKFPRGAKEEGEGVHALIKKVWLDKKP
jgi:SAGA-associated factor 29